MTMSSWSTRVHAIPLIIAFGLFMENMDATVLTTALPALSHELGSSITSMQLALTAYVVGLGVFIPICGWVADKYGSRSVYRAAIAIFLIGSLLCAVSDSLLELVCARFVQGIGGALMVPVGRIIIFRSVPRDEFIRAIGYLTIPALFGPVIGPPLGGFIATFFHWRFIFLINIPIGILGMVLATGYIHNHHSDDPGPLDVYGLFFSSIGSTGVMLGLSLIGGSLVSHEIAYGLLFTGSLSLLLYRHYATRSSRRGCVPLIDLSFFDIPTFRASVLGGSLFRMGLGALPFLLPLSLQEGLGLSPFESGMITCSSALGGLLMKSFSLSILRKIGFRTTLIYNALFAGISSVACGFFTPHTSIWLIVIAVLTGGFFPALQFTCLNTIAYADIPSKDVGRATSLASVVQQLSLGIGVAISSLSLQISQHLQSHSIILYSDFWPAFLVMGAFSFSSAIVTQRLSSSAGDELTRRNVPPNS